MVALSSSHAPAFRLGDQKPTPAAQVVGDPIRDVVDDRKMQGNARRGGRSGAPRGGQGVVDAEGGAATACACWCVD